MFLPPIFCLLFSLFLKTKFLYHRDDGLLCQEKNYRNREKILPVADTVMLRGQMIVQNEIFFFFSPELPPRNSVVVLIDYSVSFL